MLYSYTASVYKRILVDLCISPTVTAIIANIYDELVFLF